MKEFDETSAAEVSTEGYDQDQTNWLPAKEAVDYPAIVALAAYPGDTKFGPKMFLHCEIEGDEAHTEYTISFTAKSAAYAQLERINAEEGAAAFPFRCAVFEIGRTFRIGAALTPTAEQVQATAQPAKPAAPAAPKRPVPPQRRTLTEAEAANIPF